MSLVSYCMKLAAEHDKTMQPYQEKEPAKRKMRKKINSLENQVSTLENVIKDELYKEFMEKLGEPMKVDRLKKENKRLRLQVKSLKEIIKNND